MKSLLIPSLLLILYLGGCSVVSVVHKDTVADWGDKIIDEQYRVDPLGATSNIIGNRGNKISSGLAMSGILLSCLFLIGSFVFVLYFAPNVLKQINQLRKPIKQNNTWPKIVPNWTPEQLPQQNSNHQLTNNQGDNNSWFD